MEWFEILSNKREKDLGKLSLIKLYGINDILFAKLLSLDGDLRDERVLFYILTENKIRFTNKEFVYLD